MPITAINWNPDTQQLAIIHLTCSKCNCRHFIAGVDAGARIGKGSETK